MDIKNEFMERKREFLEEPFISNYINEINLGINLPESLFHYTSASSMQNILTTNTLWMTKIDFVNDRDEINYACNLFVNRIENSAFPDKEQLICLFKNESLKQIYSNAFIISLSSDSDSLPLWSYYGKSDGYNVEIDTQLFTDLSNSNCIKIRTLTPNGFVETDGDRCVQINHNSSNSYSRQIIGNKVLYNVDEQTRIFDRIIEEIAYWYANNNYIYISLYLTLATQLIPFFKHFKYEQESEYRVLLKLMESPSSPELNMSGFVKYRVFQGALIPYIELMLNAKSYFKSITIGPANNFELVTPGIEYLKKYHQSISETRKSIIPSRF